MTIAHKTLLGRHTGRQAKNTLLARPEARLCYRDALSGRIEGITPPRILVFINPFEAFFGTSFLRRGLSL